MGKVKTDSDVTSDRSADGADEDEDEDYGEEITVSEVTGIDLGLEDVGLAGGIDKSDTRCHSLSVKARERQDTKKRLDAYLERKMLEENGWDEDDELFDDEFFSGN